MKDKKNPVRVITMPYIPLPEELFRTDGTCSVYLFKQGLTSAIDRFYASIINSGDKVLHLTEEQWLERFKQFAESIGEKSVKS